MIGAPLRTLIVDDEPVARSRLRILCTEMPEIFRVIGEAGNGQKALKLISEIATDLVLLDIAMPDLDGLAVGAALARVAAPPIVVFCTAYPNHALEAFDVSAVDYLLKPVGRERLAQAATKAARVRAGDFGAPPPPTSWLDQLWVPHRDSMVRIDVRDVERIEAEGDYVRIVTARTSHLLHETMTRLERRLDLELFVRVRRSTIVRADILVTAKHLGKGVWNVGLVDGTLVRVGPTYWKALKYRLQPA